MTIEYSNHFAPQSSALIEEIAALSAQIFSPPAIDYSWRLTRMPEVSVFCAHHEGKLVGFKAGYAMAESKYYSWLGAIHPEFRNRGIATRLAHMQHSWLLSRGYSIVETSSQENNPIMARVNLGSGFSVVGTKRESHGLQVLWSKQLA